MDLKLKQKRVVVTGGTKAIGGAIVRGFLDEGAHVFTNFKSDDEAAKEFESNLSQEHQANLRVVQVDTSTRVGALELIDLARRTLGGFDVLVNNAGRKDDASKGMFTFDDIDFDKIFGTNLRGFLYLTRQAIHMMSRTGGGRIVNISSVAPRTANPNELLYACSKAGVEAATRTFALHGAQYGIGVNAIAPALIASGMGLGRALEPETLKGIPLGRAGREEEVAALVLFLASEVSAFITGTVVPIDGGRLIAR